MIGVSVSLKLLKKPGDKRRTSQHSVRAFRQLPSSQAPYLSPEAEPETTSYVPWALLYVQEYTGTKTESESNVGFKRHYS